MAQRKNETVTEAKSIMNPKFKNNIGICVPELMMPGKKVDLTKWACVACDQYTSQPDYWNSVEQIVGDAPSTLRLMLPEIYLEKPGEAERIVAIRKAMNDYMADGTLENRGEGFVFTRRTVDGKVRKDVKYPVGFMDVITLLKAKTHYRLLYDVKGKFGLVKISADEAQYKLCRVIRRTFSSEPSTESMSATNATSSRKPLRVGSSAESS